ncbi:MAG: dual specificity protein phosphatase family protein [Chloroflexi bacterium]|nr:dual specificity protein phosphatase family protein [Chloroflexota bacterium]
MASIVRKLRNRRQGITEETDILDISKITDGLFVSNWPIAKHEPEIVGYGIELIICTIWESQDKELNQPPLKMIHIRMTDAPFMPLPMSQLRRGVEAALPVLEADGRVLVFCKSGIHRSVAMASCILIGQGYSAEEAMRMVADAREIADPYKPHIRKRIEKFEPYWNEQQGHSN